MKIKLARSKIRGKSYNKTTNRSLTFLLFTIPGLGLYTIFSVTPIIMGFYYSLTDWNGYSRNFEFVWFKNFQTILRDERFYSALTFNFKYSFFLVIGLITLSIMIALLLNSKLRGVTYFRAIYFFPAVLSMLTVGLIFNQVFYRIVPPFGTAIGIQFLEQSLLSRSSTAIFGVLFVHLWQGLALPTILVLAGLQTVPADLYEAAAIDGISPRQKFFQITLPFLLPVLSVVLVLALKSGIMVFDYIMSMTSGGPGGSTESLALLIYRHGFAEDKFSYSIAEAILAGIIISLVSAIQITASNRKRIEL
ncbi:sugar ABC transporter permease [uncultured Sphaerochaeta sp.]|uniref:carbohydrate ABC transporter permease n=1 Tax=uncultured Sphaerochaeta sp. TaxID=886478 RepID=UPI002AA7B532|nr:sugar ABC transporter permease [uncultured Sphaerochaeta sp.]